MSGQRVCIVSSGALSSGPRVEKEADALAEAGYRVHVLLCHAQPELAAWDDRLATSKPWTHETILWHRHLGLHAPLWLATRGTRALCRTIAKRTVAGPALAELAYTERLLPMVLRGLSRRADLYIAHNLAALPVAALLARRYGARFAFDAEDDHLGEIPDTHQHSSAAALTDRLQARYLPGCAHVTAASQGIADELARRYGIAPPTVVHNVFPWSLRDTIDGRTLDRRGEALSLYWFSQTIGLDRGLQDVIRAAGMLRGNFAIRLRGNISESVRRELLLVARHHGVADRLFFHEPVHPEELPSRTAEHDVGLALEQPVNRNRLQTVTNKIFLYMVCGLALVATDTPGQSRVMKGVSPDAGFVYTPGDAEALATGLQRWIDEPSALRSARREALEAARSTWCWERERAKLVERVRADLAAR